MPHPLRLAGSQGPSLAFLSTSTGARRELTNTNAIAIAIATFCPLCTRRQLVRQRAPHLLGKNRGEHGEVAFYATLLLRPEEAASLARPCGVQLGLLRQVEGLAHGATAAALFVRMPIA